MLLAQGQPDAAQSRRLDGINSTATASLLVNQIDTSKFPEVTLFVTVLKDGEPVLGLGERDFRVREDEVDQEPLQVSPKLDPLKAVVTIDTSGSIKKSLPAVQTAASEFIGVLDQRDAFTVISFSREVKVLNNSGNREQARHAIASTVARGDTALYDALYESVKSLEDTAGRKAVVLLSDGVDDNGAGQQLSKHSLQEGLDLSRKVNVPVYALGLGKDKDPAVLQKIATDTGGLYFDAPQAADLQSIYSAIGRQLKGQYAIHYTSNLPADGTTHRIKVDSTSINTFGIKEYIAPSNGIAGKSAATASSTSVTPAQQAETKVVEVKQTALPPGVHVQAVLVDGGQPFTIDQFRVFNAPDDFAPEQDQKTELAHSDYSVAKWTFALKPGKYQLDGRKGQLRVSKVFEVKGTSGQAEDLVFNAAVLNVVAKMTEDTPRVQVDKFAVARMDDAFSEDKNFDTAYSTELWTVVIPAGKIALTAKKGVATIRREMDVKAGEALKETLVFNGGAISMIAAMTADGEAVKVDYFQILKVSADGLEEPKTLDSAYSADKWNIAANQGKYLIRVKLDKAYAELPIELKAGEVRKEKLNLNAGLLELVVSAEGDPRGVKAKKLYVKRPAAPGVDTRELESSYSSDKLLVVLPPGQYLVGAVFDGGEEEVPVEIKAGARLRQEMKLVK